MAWSPIAVRRATPADGARIAERLASTWGSTTIASNGQTYGASQLPTLVAVQETERVGGGQCPAFGVEPEQHQRRILNDGSSHDVYKRYFTSARLAAELGGGEVLHEGHWFVAVAA